MPVFRSRLVLSPELLADNFWSRPVVGFINFCEPATTASSAERDIYYDVMVTLHELVHILFMSSDHLRYFRDENGSPRTNRDASGVPDSTPATTTQAVSTERGVSTIKRVVTPAVQAFTREHYDCSTATGAEIEDDGGSGTVGSHWEMRTVLTDFMTGSLVGYRPIWTGFSSAIARDSGWYGTPEWTPMTYGKGLGCSFVTDACPTDGTYPWCSASQASSSTKVCTFDHQAFGTCSTSLALNDACPIAFPQTSSYCNDTFFLVNFSN